MFLASNIKYLRNKATMRQQDLADILGYKAGATVNSWEMGKNTPPPKTLDKLATMFNVSVDQLLYTDLTTGSTPKRMPGASVRIKVLGSVPAGIAMEAIQDIVDWQDIPCDWTSGGREYFGLRVRGDSMSPQYLDGDTIICRKQSDCDSGQDAIIFVNGSDAVFKRVFKQPEQIVLQPLNSAYEPKFYRYDDEQNPISILGVVVEIRRSV